MCFKVDFVLCKYTDDGNYKGNYGAGQFQYNVF